MDSIDIFDVRIDSLTLDEALKRATQAHGTPCTVVTPNALMLQACRRDTELGKMLCRATLSLPDGAGVVRAAKRKGTPLPSRIAGIDFGEALLRRAAEDGLRVFFLGGKDGVAARAAERMKQAYPHLTVCGTYYGYGLEHPEENERLLDALSACRPDILFVCLGFPLQERWIFEHLPSLSHIRIIAGLGGSLDVWAGAVARAPHLVQGLGAEWAWRMLRQPKRLRGLPSLLAFAFCDRKKL